MDSKTTDSNRTTVHCKKCEDQKEIEVRKNMNVYYASMDVETVATNDPPSKLETQLNRQIEYYFGDVNLPRDKFLQEQIKLDDGWVPLETMFKFKRLANLTSKNDVVIAALAKSPGQLMEVSDDKQKIRRSLNKPLPIINRRGQKNRTVYVKGFPLEDFTSSNIQEYFTQIGPVESVQMRFYKDQVTGQQTFKGSSFVVFKTYEEAEKFMELVSVKYGEVELTRKWLSVHIKDKQRESQKRRKPTLPKGCVLHIKGLGANNIISREDVSAELESLSDTDIAFITYSKGDTELWVRFREENSAKKLVAEHMADGNYTLCNFEVQVQLLQGKEEEAFLEKSLKDIADFHEHRWHYRYSKWGGGRGGRGGNRGGCG